MLPHPTRNKIIVQIKDDSDIEPDQNDNDFMDRLAARGMEIAADEMSSISGDEPDPESVGTDAMASASSATMEIPIRKHDDCIKKRSLPTHTQISTARAKTDPYQGKVPATDLDDARMPGAPSRLCGKAWSKSMAAPRLHDRLEAEEILRVPAPQAAPQLTRPTRLGYEGSAPMAHPPLTNPNRFENTTHQPPCPQLPSPRFPKRLSVQVPPPPTPPPPHRLMDPVRPKQKPSLTSPRPVKVHEHKQPAAWRSKAKYQPMPKGQGLSRSQRRKKNRFHESKTDTDRDCLDKFYQLKKIRRLLSRQVATVQGLVHKCYDKCAGSEEKLATMSKLVHDVLEQDEAALFRFEPST